MCKELCDEADNGYTCCQDCGRMICWDTKSVDDVCAPAAVSSSGDLFCLPCAQRADREEERMLEEEGMDDYDCQIHEGDVP